MTSVLRSTKQISADAGYFIAITSAQEANIYTLASVLAVQTAGSGALTSYSSRIGVAGDLYKDMGRTIMATLSDGSSLTFRKVQYVDPRAFETGGVSGGVSTSTDDGFNTGYILLGLNGAGTQSTVTGHASYNVTLVAKYGF
jgi:hypothetical protein